MDATQIRLLFQATKMPPNLLQVASHFPCQVLPNFYKNSNFDLFAYEFLASQID